MRKILTISIVPKPTTCALCFLPFLRFRNSTSDAFHRQVTLPFPLHKNIEVDMICQEKPRILDVCRRVQMTIVNSDATSRKASRLDIGETWNMCRG